MLLYGSTEILNLRTSTVKAFDLRNNNDLRELIFTACAKFCSIHQFGQALKTLFALLYGDANEREHALNLYGFTYHPADEEVERENPENLYVFRTLKQIEDFANELRHQYTLRHPFFLKVKADAHYEKELAQLQKVMSNVPTLLYIAFNSSYRIRDNRKQVEYCYNLMKSDKENEFLNGLKNMGHNSRYADLLKPYAKEIADLLMAMSDAYEEEQAYISHGNTQPNFCATPFSELGNLLKANGINLPNECEPEPDSPVTNGCKNTSILSKYIDHKSMFEDYFHADTSKKWELLKELRIAGFDLNEIFDKEQILQSLLTAHNALVAAQKAESEAQTRFEEVSKNFSASNTESIRKLLEIREALDNAQAVAEQANSDYDEAINAFFSAN